jgi:hypothetical protein
MWKCVEDSNAKLPDNEIEPRINAETADQKNEIARDKILDLLFDRR